MREILCNDKFLVTSAVTILGLCSFLWSIKTGVSAENIITAIVSGLFGMAAGSTLARRTTDRPEASEKKEP